jgi:hypothetical protein
MNPLKRILPITALVLAFALSLSATQTNNWVKFAPPGGGFSIMLPAQPKELELTPVADFTSHGYGLNAEGTIYVVLFGDYAATVHLNPDAELIANRDNFLKGLSASLVTTKKIELDGRAGLEFTGQTAQADLQSRVYISGNRVYQVAVSTPKGSGDSRDASHFINSFAFADNKDHVKP